MSITIKRQGILCNNLLLVFELKRNNSTHVYTKLSLKQIEIKNRVTNTKINNILLRTHSTDHSLQERD